MNKNIIVACGVAFVLIMGAFYMGKNSSYKSTTENKAEVINPPISTTTPKADPTKDWETFTNTQYEFSFKYPHEWTVTDRMSEGIPTVKVAKFFNFEKRSDIQNGNWVEMKLDTAIDEAKISAWNNAKYADSYSKAQIQSSDFQGKKLYRVTSTTYETKYGVDKETYTLYRIYIPMKEGYIQLSSNANMKNTLEQMFSTFKSNN